MQVGDLVQLSAYGEARGQNSCCFGGWGFIVEIRADVSSYPIKAHWYRLNDKRDGGMMNFHPRELKRYKPDKK
jgi:hypothetical protein